MKLKLNWTMFVSSRFAQVDNKGRYAATSFLAALGIGFGVATLIVVLSVMNGFQSGYIDSIMEISSFHVRGTKSQLSNTENIIIQEDSLNIEQTFNQSKNDLNSQQIINSLYALDDVTTVVPMYEAQALLVGKGSRQTPGLIRGVPSDICKTDSGFAKEVQIVSGDFDISENGTIVLGYYLARTLKVSVGDKINLLAMSGGKDTDLLSENRYLTVTGTFTCGYADISSTFAFVSLETADSLIQDKDSLLYGIKLKNSEFDSRFIAKAKSFLPDLDFESWRSYNRSFFGALRVEKNVLMLLVLLIFVVVAINIYNSMRRLVYERREEIAVLAALGASKNNLRIIFLTQGLQMGIKGAIPGLIIGLFICAKMKSIFTFFSMVVSSVSHFFAILFNSDSAFGISSVYSYYSSIPAKVVFSEVALFTLFGIFASVVASLLASKSIMNLSISEVLKDE